jgi:DNA repair ATPase RecN
MPYKRNTSSSSKRQKSSTPLDAAQKKIAEEEAKLRVQMQKYEQLIEEAPKIAAERKRRAEELERVRREEAVRRRAKIEGRFGPLGLPDRRYELNAGAPAKQRRLRAERNRGRFMFFILLLLFGAALAYLWYTVTRG